MPEDTEEFMEQPDGQILLPQGFYPGLECAPVHDPTRFSFTAPLEAASAMIRAEAADFVQRSPLLEQEAWSADFFSGSYGESYSGIAIARHGKPLEDAVRELPETTSLLNELGIDGGNRLVHLARQAPHSGVESHSDGLSYLLTGHLGLEIPPHCGMEVNGESVVWEEGKLSVVQNSFRHHTTNQSDSERILLYFDFWHPSLSSEEQQALSLFEETRRSFQDEQQKRMLMQPDMQYLTNLVDRMHTMKPN
jgi:aspartate beta-hydroxylase